jgi:hypothetical protein
MLQRRSRGGFRDDADVFRDDAERHWTIAEGYDIMSVKNIEGKAVYENQAFHRKGL